ncbi:MAG: hypothetical protein GF388_02285 [Candidatus Aegiribacteria sp.]|nr:hypothetical protein [Candidatus Aegiribacteria sp.]MBD3294148.1 hypothetical protein [Candidatus Fermentibacteria bacterium]
MLYILILTLTGFGPWESVGPQGGEMKAVLQSTQDANTLFAMSGTYPTQVVRSTDGGATWETISTFTNSTPYDMVMTENGTLVALGSSRTWRSTDEGLTWTENYVTSSIFYDGEAHPSDGDRLFVAGYSYSGGTWNISLFKSVDCGVSWSSTTVASAGYSTYGRSIAVSASDPDRIVIGGYGYSSGYYPMFYISDDGGTTFADITPPSASYYFQGAAIHPSQQDVILAGDLVNVFRSDDAGATWTNVSSTYQNSEIRYSKADSDLLLAGGSSQVLSSADGGSSWTGSSSGLSGSGIRWAVPDRTDADIAYTGTSTGFYFSSDAGQTWSSSNGGLLIGRVLAMENVDGWIYMNMQDMGLFRGEDLSTITWEQVDTPLSCGDFCDIESLSSDTILALEGAG